MPSARRWAHPAERLQTFQTFQSPQCQAPKGGCLFWYFLRLFLCQKVGWPCSHTGCPPQVASAFPALQGTALEPFSHRWLGMHRKCCPSLVHASMSCPVA